VGTDQEMSEVLERAMDQFCHVLLKVFVSVQCFLMSSSLSSLSAVVAPLPSYQLVLLLAWQPFMYLLDFGTETTTGEAD